MKTKFLVLIAVLFFIACEKQNNLLESTSPNSNTFEEARPFNRKGKPKKIDICHYDAETNSYKILNVSERSWPDHASHGDVRLDDPDGDGYVPTNGCGYGNMGDCNDNEGTVYPGAEEICGDGIDNDCIGGDEVCVELPTITLDPTNIYSNSVYLALEDLNDEGVDGFIILFLFQEKIQFCLNARQNSPDESCFGGYDPISGTVTIRQGDKEESGNLTFDINGAACFSIDRANGDISDITATLTSWSVGNTFICD